MFSFRVWIFLGLLATLAPLPSLARIQLHISIDGEPFEPISEFSQGALTYVNATHPGSLSTVSFAATHDDPNVINDPDADAGAYLSLKFYGDSLDVSSCTGTGFTVYDGHNLEMDDTTCNYKNATDGDYEACAMTCDAVVVAGPGPFEIVAEWYDEWYEPVLIDGRDKMSWGGVVWPDSVAEFGIMNATAEDSTVGARTPVTFTFVTPVDLNPYTYLELDAAVDALAGGLFPAEPANFDFSRMASFASSDYPIIVAYLQESNKALVQFVGDEVIPAGETISFVLFDLKNPMFFERARPIPVAIFDPYTGIIARGRTSFGDEPTPGQLEILGVSLSDPFAGKRTRLDIAVSLPFELRLASLPTKLAAMRFRVSLPADVMPVPPSNYPGSPGSQETTLPIKDYTVDSTLNWAEAKLAVGGISGADVPAGQNIVVFKGVNPGEMFGPLAGFFNASHELHLELVQGVGPLFKVWADGTFALEGVDIFEDQIEIHGGALSSRVTGEATDITFNFTTPVPIPPGAIVEVVFPFTKEDFDYTPVADASWAMPAPPPGSGSFASATLGPDENKFTVMINPPTTAGAPNTVSIVTEARRVVQATRVVTGGAELGPGTYAVKIGDLVHPDEPPKSGARKYKIRIRDHAGRPVAASNDEEVGGLAILNGFIEDPRVSLSSNAVGEPWVTATVSFSLTSDVVLDKMDDLYRIELEFPAGYPFSPDVRDAAVASGQCYGPTAGGDCSYYRTAYVDPPMRADFFWPSPTKLEVTLSRCDFGCFDGEVNKVPAGDRISIELYDVSNPFQISDSPGPVFIDVTRSLFDAETNNFEWVSVAEPSAPPFFPAIVGAEIERAVVNFDDATTNTETKARVRVMSPFQVPFSHTAPTIVVIVFPEEYTVQVPTDVVDVKYEECDWTGACFLVNAMPQVDSTACFTGTNICSVVFAAAAGEHDPRIAYEDTEWLYVVDKIRTPADPTIADPVNITIAQGVGPAADILASTTTAPRVFASVQLTGLSADLTSDIVGASGNLSIAFTSPSPFPSNTSLALKMPSSLPFGLGSISGGYLLDDATGTEWECADSFVPAPGSRLDGIDFVCVLDLAESMSPGTYTLIVANAKNPFAAASVEGIAVFGVLPPPADDPNEIAIGAVGVVATGPELKAETLDDVVVRDLDPEKGGTGSIEVSFTTPVDIPAEARFVLSFPDLSTGEAAFSSGFGPTQLGHYGVPDPNTPGPFIMETIFDASLSVDDARYACELRHAPKCEGFSLSEEGQLVLYFEPLPLNTIDPDAAWQSNVRTSFADLNPDDVFFSFGSIIKTSVPTAGLTGSLSVEADTDTIEESKVVWTRTGAGATLVPKGTKIVFRVDKVTHPKLTGYAGDFPSFSILDLEYEDMATASDIQGPTLVETPGDQIQGQPYGTVRDSRFKIKTLNLEGLEFRIAEWQIDFEEDLYLGGKLLSEYRTLTEIGPQGVKDELKDTVPEITKSAQGSVQLWCRSGTAPYDILRSVPSWPCDTCSVDDNKKPSVDQNALLAAAAEKKFGAIDYSDPSDTPLAHGGEDYDDFAEIDYGDAANIGAGFLSSQAGGDYTATPGSTSGGGEYSRCKRDPPPRPPSVGVQYPPTRMLLVAPPYRDPLVGLLPSFGGTVLDGGELLSNRLNLVMVLSAHAPPNAESVFFEPEFFEDCSVLVPGHGRGQMYKKQPDGKTVKIGTASETAASITDKAGRAIKVRLDLERDTLDAEAGNAFDAIPPWQSTDCNYTRFRELSAEIESVVARMDSAVGLFQSRAVRTLLASLTATDDYTNCVKLVDSLVTDSIDRRTVTLRDSTACYETDTRSEAYKNDPCCNKKLSATKCCAPRDIDITYLANAEPFYLNIEKMCNLDLYCDLANRWIPNYVADKDVMITNPATGCSAVRASLVTDELWDSLRAFETTCLNHIFGPDGWSGPTCKRDTDCRTRCKKDNPWDEEGRCAVPQGPEGVDIVLACFVENMTPLVESKLADMWGVTIPTLSADGEIDTSSDFYQRFFLEVTTVDCVGPRACKYRNGFESSGLNERGEWFFTTKSADTVNCEAEEACNWDDSVNDRTLCESPPGKSGAEKTHFCQACDGPFCMNLEFHGITTEAECGTEYCDGVPCADHALCSSLCGTEECQDEAQCLGQGNSTCNDESHYSFDDVGREVEAVCWAPPEANPITGAPEPCLATVWPDDASVWPDDSFGCLFADLNTESRCESSGIEGARWIPRATNQTACEEKVQACWDDVTSSWTLHDEDECNSCGREWRSAFTWSLPKWETLPSVDTTWTERKWSSVNKLKPALDLSKVKTVVDNLIDSVIGGFFKSEAKCRVSLLSVQKNIICACAEGNADRAAECTSDIRQDLGGTYMNKDSVTAGKGVGSQDIARGSSIGADAATMSSTNPNVLLNKTISPANAFALCTDTARRARSLRDPVERGRFEALRRPSLDTSSFNVIRNTAGDIIGQILGGGLEINKDGTGDLSTCIETDPSIAQNADYTELAFGDADATGYPSGIRSVAVSKDADGKICGTVLDSGTYFPVAYDPNFTPATPTPTPTPEPNQLINVTIAGTAAAFDEGNQTQFLNDLAETSKAPASAMRVVSVTDAPADASTRRTLAARARHVRLTARSVTPGAARPALIALASTSRIIVLVEVQPSTTMTAATAADLVRAAVSNPASPLVTQYGMVPTTTVTTTTGSPAPPGPPSNLNITLKYTLAEFNATRQTEFAAAIATRLGIQAADVKVTAVSESQVSAQTVVIATVEISDSTTGGGFVMSASLSANLLAYVVNDSKEDLTVTWRILTADEGGSTTVPPTPTPAPPVPSPTPTPSFNPYDPVTTTADFDLTKPSAAAHSATPSPLILGLVALLTILGSMI